MANANLTGKTATFTFASSEIDITNFTVSITGGVLEVTDSADSASTYNRNVPEKFANWSATGTYKLKAADGTPTIHAEGSFVGSGAAAATAVRTYTGEAAITGIEADFPIINGSVATGTITVTGTGELTIVNTEPA